jgi:hypothetical protein
MPFPLLLFGFAAILVATVLLVARAIRKEAATNQRLATDLGFAPAANTGELQERLAMVRGRLRPGLLQLSHVFRRHDPVGALWLYSLHRRNSDEDGIRRGNRPSKSHYSPLETNAIGVVVSAWNWPRHVATPRLPGTGKLADLANSMAEKLTEANARRLEFPHIAGLDQHYLIAAYGADTPPLPNALLHALAATPGLLLHLAGDTLSLSWANAATRPPDAARMRELVGIARRLAQTLQDES